MRGAFSVPLLWAATAGSFACENGLDSAGVTSDTLLAVPVLTGTVTSDGLASESTTPYTGDNDLTDPGQRVRGFVTFDLTTIPAGKVVRTAFLKIPQRGVDGTPYNDLGVVVLDHLLLGATLDSDDFEAAALDSAFVSLSTDPALATRTVNVFPQIKADVEAGRDVSQFRLRFSVNDGDNDDVTDRAAFNGTGDVPPPIVIVTFNE